MPKENSVTPGQYSNLSKEVANLLEGLNSPECFDVRSNSFKALLREYGKGEVDLELAGRIKEMLKLKFVINRDFKVMYSSERGALFCGKFIAIKLSNTECWVLNLEKQLVEEKFTGDEAQTQADRYIAAQEMRESITEAFN